MEKLRKPLNAVFVVCNFSVFIFLALDIQRVYSNWILQMLCNIALSGLIPIAVFILCAYSYFTSGNNRALMMGCGMLALGLGSVLTGIMRFISDSDNIIITAYNLSVFASSVLHLLAATIQLPEKKQEKATLARWLLAAASGVVLYVGAVSWLAASGFIPTFFDQNGSSRIRDIFLWSTVAFFFASAAIFFKSSGFRQGYLRWYAMALASISVGLFGIAQMSTMDTPLVWAGRLSQYVGCVFALVSMIEVVLRARRKGVSPTEIMIEFFQDAESNYRALVEQISSSVIIVDDEYRIIFSNSIARKLFDVREDKILNKSFPDTLLTEESRKLLREKVDAAKLGIVACHEPRMLTLEAVRSDGTLLTVELSFSLKMLPTSYACTFAMRDITAYIEQEKRLLQQAEELKRSNQLMTVFFTNISHEFKTPLTLILNLIGMTEMRVKSADCPNRENMIKNLSVMRQNAHRLLRLVANLLDVTKMDAGFMQVYYQVMDLPRWMGKLLQSVEDFAEQRGIRVTFHDDSDIQFIPMDGEKLDRIMLNLISNAIKHTGRGGHIAITMTDEANKLLISVADDGEGIPLEKQFLIFDRFRQANTPLTRASEGSGIGLALTKALVELLRGRIWFESKPGKGTIFFVELPVTELSNDIQLPVMDGLTLNRKVEMEFSDII